MGFQINGVDVTDVQYNGNPVTEVQIDGVKVWPTAVALVDFSGVPAAIVDFRSGGDTARAEYGIRSDGTHYQRSFNTTTDISPAWLVQGAVTVQEYRVRINGGSFSAWNVMTAVSWTVTRESFDGDGVSTLDLDIEVRDVATQTLQDSFSTQLRASWSL